MASIVEALDRMAKIIVNPGSEQEFERSIPLKWIMNTEMMKKIPEDHDGFFFIQPNLTPDILDKMVEYLRYFHEHPLDMKKDFDKPLIHTLEVYLAKKPEFAFYQAYLDELWNTHITVDGKNHCLTQVFLNLINYMDPLLIHDCIEDGSTEYRSHLYTLFTLCCMYYANKMKSMSKEQILKMFQSKEEGGGAGEGAGGSA